MNPRSEKDRISAILFIIVFLLVVVIVIMVLKTVDDKRAAQAQNTEISTQSYQPPQQDPNALVTGADTVPTANPYESVNALPTTAPAGGNGSGGGSTYTAPTQAPAPTRAPTPAPTQAPAPAPAPTQAPAPAPAPTEAPAPAPTQAPEVAFTPVQMGTGSVDSETPTGLNIRAEWSAKAISPTQVEVTVTVYCLHQTLYTGAYNPVNFLVDGQYASVYGRQIESDSYEFHSTELASKTFTIDLAQGESKTFWINVEWEYGGRYSGVQLDSIECGSNITLRR